jgi:hypothetical protein
VYPENLDGVGARSAQDLAKTLHGRKIRPQANRFPHLQCARKLT